MLQMEQQKFDAQVNRINSDFPLRPKAKQDTFDEKAMRSFITRSMKQGERAVQCYIIRRRDFLNVSATYELYLEGSNQFIMAARKRKKTKTSSYILSMEKTPSNKKSALVVGKLRSNWVSNKYLD